MATKREISKENTISAIMAAAAAEFSERGYNSTTIRSIASRAEVASGLVCTYFDTKENLLRQVVSRYKPEVIFEGIRDADPYAALCAYLNHVRALQKNDPVQFKLHLKVAGRTGFPDSVLDVIRSGFRGSKIESTIMTAQQRGQLVRGDPFQVFEILSASAYVLLNEYAELGAEEFRVLTGNSFRGIVHPDDYARSEASIAEQIKRDSRSIDHITYRFIRKDGSVGTLDDYGHFSRSRSFGDIYYVFVQDITKEQLEKQRAAQMELLNSVLTDYDGVFLIDCENDTRRTFHDRLSGAANYNDAENYSSAFARYADAFACEPDREMMRAFADPAGILKLLGGRKELTVTYRDRTTGTQRFYEMRIIRYSDTEVLQSFRENDEEMVNRLLFEKLKDNYFALFAVDLESSLVRSYKDDPLHAAGKEGEIADFSAVMRNLAAQCEGENRAFFERYSDVQRIKTRFADEDRAEYVCRSAQKDRSDWVNITGVVFTRNADGTPSLFCLAFHYLDESAARVREMQMQLLEEPQRSELFFETFSAGKWMYEISADDEVVSAAYSDAVYTTCVKRPISTCSRPKRERSLTTILPISPASTISSIRLRSGRLKVVPEIPSSAAVR